MLALHLADYRLRFGEIPQQDVSRLLGVSELDAQQSVYCRMEWPDT
jgi:hypothetical protein